MFECMNLLEVYLVLGNILIFYDYRDISLDNILYRAYFLISKYRIPIFIIFMYVKDESNARVTT